VIPNVCVGIASVARDGSRYFKHVVGPVLEGLDKSEREGLHLILFIAHTDPSTHPAYAEKWMQNIADTLLSYDLTPGELKHVKHMEVDKGFFREKVCSTTPTCSRQLKGPVLIIS